MNPSDDDRFDLPGRPVDRNAGKRGPLHAVSDPAKASEGEFHTGPGGASGGASEPPEWATEEIPEDPGGPSPAMPSHPVSRETQLANMNGAKRATELHAVLKAGPGRLPLLSPDAPPKPRAMLLTRRPEDGEDGEDVGYLPRGIVALLIGEGGGGKSQAAIQLAVAVATAGKAPPLKERTPPEGGHWLGTYQATAPGRVLLALAEEDAEEIHRRVWRTVRALEERERGGRVWSSPGQWHYAEAVQEHVRPWALHGVSCGFIQGKATKPGEESYKPTLEFEEIRSKLDDGEEWALIVLDPATRFLGADSETDNKAATEWIALAQGLTQLPGNPTVLIVHHTNKAARRDGNTDATASRGSSALTDGARWVANLTAGSAGVADLSLTLAKANYVRQPKALSLIRDSHCDGFLRAMTPQERTEREAKADAEEVEAEAQQKARRKRVDKRALALLGKDGANGTSEESGRAVKANETGGARAKNGGNGASGQGASARGATLGATDDDAG